MAMFIYTLVVVWFHREGHRSVQFPFRPWYKKKAEPSFADMLTTLRRLSYDEKTAGLGPVFGILFVSAVMAALFCVVLVLRNGKGGKGI